MKMKPFARTIVLGVGILSAGFLGEALTEGDFIIREAQAVVGRPLTPGSVAGVARRTTRRRIRRTTVYVATLPRGCGPVTIDATPLYNCGGQYYQAEGDQYVIVNVE